MFRVFLDRLKVPSAVRADYLLRFRAWFQSNLSPLVFHFGSLWIQNFVGLDNPALTLLQKKSVKRIDIRVWIKIMPDIM